MTDAEPCNCECHTADPQSEGCATCAERHEVDLADPVKRQSRLDELRAMPRPLSVYENLPGGFCCF